MKARFTIPGRLDGLNQMIGAARSHWAKSARQKRQATDSVRWILAAARLPQFTAPVRVTFTWIEPDAGRDIDNISAGAKPILDALVKERRLADDSRAHVRELVHLFPDPDLRNPRIEVLIEELPREGTCD